MKFSNYFLILFLVAFAVRCSQNIEKRVVPRSEEGFKAPLLVDFPRNGDVMDTLGQLESIAYPMCVMRGDSINFESISPIARFQYFLDSVEYSTANSLELFIEDEQTFSSKFWDTRKVYPQIKTIDADGIVQKSYEARYDTVMKFPVFIFNRTDSIQALEHHDGRIVMIQEALDRDGKWKPIEFFRFSGCGNSYGLNLIEPNQYLMFGVNRYEGDFKTKLRVRLRTNGKVLLSNEYYGSINEEQMIPVDPEIRWDQYLKSENASN